jgi:hypothetical protein
MFLVISQVLKSPTSSSAIPFPPHPTTCEERMRLAREPGAGSGEQGKRERGVGIVVRNPEIDKFHQK